METFTRLEAIACPIPFESIDTDQLIPARFMSRSRAQGYGGFLLHDMRCDADGRTLGTFPLDVPRYTGARIIVARRNFGSGSSREAAVYALWDFGIRVVIAPSFGDIFASNAVKNGLVPAIVSEADAQSLIDGLAKSDPPQLVVDLEKMTITACEITIAFTIDPVRRLQLLNGWDDIDLTLKYVDAIRDFRQRRQVGAPWVFQTSR
jgi:3-isopropylmalate/(R)-2-methylmalate dehydratase small subunit